MADGDEDFITSVISVFLEEVPADLETLESAIQNKDYEMVYQMAHKIKPNVDLLGMEQTRATALEIETLGKSEEISKVNSEEIASKFPLLKQDVNQVISELKKDFNL